jgi:hypothetical protein
MNAWRDNPNQDDLGGDGNDGMGSVPPLLSFLLLIAAGRVHRHQLIVIEFLQARTLLKDRLRGR